ncbi:MAG: hypothetical protein MRY67_06615 [Rhodovulum sp.]|jgi:hypothetical protein|uniref:hypothetical protein n=1 Tax=Rhodovulum sp. FJ3 TaxID=3079053 RepID=UPI000C0A6CCD|nr:hypothetical protein [Rhodovulum sp. FJ3]MAY33372.1 hypothetical protein [Rhodovulum sp.]MEC8629043.1 hypothetical protein [Pseudomonadota bacterium]MCI5085572.1 hypothetical protein [Rhodovulum sp.]MDV4168920.1 hypothetical protein [Rhodovulum sp. FJ3]MEC8795245.1 hypothetical protein [Pseudomonadota bacterium]|tara:strand:+ start:1025 stop:1204 length:180 start_codon:yes stop_codon:yes gene_type:complete
MKICSLTCVIGWLAFWAFGFLAISAQGAPNSEIMTSSLLAFAGLMAGAVSYLKLAQGIR